ncbi:sulfotransferase [Planctomycetota bacterium]|nr:sulfotransferase [Planctomycetota bacterium]
MSQQKKPIQLIYITSRGHSGSTLLDYLISSHPQIISAGEVKVISPDWKRRCSCNAPSIWKCPFWLQIDDYLQQNHNRSMSDLKINSDDSQRFASDNYAFFDAVRALTNAEMIVDSSKSVARLRKLHAAPNIDLHMLKLRRHPCGVVYSNVKKQRSWYSEAIKYKRHELSSSRFHRGKKHLKVKYENLALNPQDELQRVMSFLGMSYDPSQLDGINDTDRHNIGGNHMRFTPNKKIKLDQQWQANLNFFQKSVIKCLCH